MCTLAIYFRVSRDFPLVIAANRDERLDRPSLPPQTLVATPWIFGGRDVSAGGTWLGLNGHRMVAGLLNRRSQQTLDPRRRSRGLLCVDALHHETPSSSAAAISMESGGDYNPFNLLIASPDEAYVVGNVTGIMRQTDLQPGLHLLSNLELNDPECPRIAKSVALFEAATTLLHSKHLGEFLASIRIVLADHSTPLDPRAPGIPDNLCVHLPGFGTRSSTILLYAREPPHLRLWYADGPPCVTAHQEVTLPHLW